MQSIAVDSYSELERKIADFIKGDGWVVCYLDYKVLIGKFEAGKMVFYKDEQFELRFLQQLRAFNEELEVLLICTDPGEFNYRIRSDENIPEELIERSRPVLWGTCFTELADGWVKLSEGRGTELIMPRLDSMPLAVSGKLDDRVKILTHNYISFNKIGQAGYTDCRFVKFEFE